MYYLIQTSFYFEFITPYGSFFAFTLETLLNELTLQLKQICLTLLN